MERPATRYAKSGDVSVAYQVTGSGPIDLVWAPGTMSHLDLDWEHAPKVAVIERLGSFSRLIRFDKRGTGMSDRPTGAATLEERTDDVIGARVASLAAPREVLVSSTVKDLVVGSGLVFEDRGVHTLKGVPDTWHLYVLVDDR